VRITDAPLGEHAVLYTLFDHVESELASGRDPAAFVGVLDAVLRSHARVEDELLFDVIGIEAGQVGGPAAAMIEEHREVSELLDRARRVEGDEAGVVLRDVIALARRHFRREEEAAFPMAEEFFDASRLREMGAAWGIRRDVRLEGSHGR